MLTLPDFKAKKVIVVFTKRGDKLSFKNDNLIVKDSEDNIKCQYTCYKIFTVLVVGGFLITTGLVERAKKFGFSIIFMTHGLKVYCTINSAMEGNTLLREKQYNNEKENLIAKQIVVNKIKNQKLILEKIRDNDTNKKKTIMLLEDYIKKINNEELNIAELMGIEGMASKVYFKQLYNQIGWKGRQPRVKRDEINLLLDIGYTLLFSYIEAITNVYGFDIYKGILHREFYKRKSLICDFIEPFRPMIDYKLRKAYNLGQIDINDFENSNGRFSLNWKNNDKYMNIFIEEILENREKIFIYIQNFYRWFMKGANLEDFPTVVLEGK